MKSVPAFLRCAALALPIILAGIAPGLPAETRKPCTEDAMIVFDASGSMSGNLDTFSTVPNLRIDEVRRAFASCSPESRAVSQNWSDHLWPLGHMTNAMCRLICAPRANAANPIIWASSTYLRPAGQTPLTKAVEQSRGGPGVSQ